MKEQINGNLICLSDEILADEETPVRVFRKIREGEKYAFLLESVEKGEIVGRYSIIGMNPTEVLVFTRGSVEIRNNGNSRNEKCPEGPLAFLRKHMKQYSADFKTEIPLSGGAVGYLGYDIVRYIEDIPDPADGPEEFPEGIMFIADTLIIFDHIKKRITITANTLLEDGNAEQARQVSEEKIQRIKEKLDQPLDYARDFICEEKDVDFTSNLSKDEFEASVVKAKEYINDGDIFQVVLSQRIACDVENDPFNIYRNLRMMNPSPYMFFFEMDDMYMVGSSPEVLVRYDGKHVNVRPIAGTRQRGRDHDEDKALAEELLSDEKERAEHLMLIDLGRNDVGRVSKYGTVAVDEEFIIERYSHVMHIVSNVIGEKHDEKDIFDVFASCFPAGTLSGAPKVRAMEIISELEPTFRGPYGGAVGYFSFNGTMDTCITIRTITVRNGKAYIQAGAGIVADSDPEFEFNETLRKATALMRAIRITK